MHDIIMFNNNKNSFRFKTVNGKESYAGATETERKDMRKVKGFQNRKR